MPIRPENKHYYTSNEYLEARRKVVERDDNQCQHCGAVNHSHIERETGYWVKIILTCAHLDQNPANNDMKNLAMLCQQCHNRHDAKARASHRMENRDKALEQLRLELDQCQP